MATGNGARGNAQRKPPATLICSRLWCIRESVTLAPCRSLQERRRPRAATAGTLRASVLLLRIDAELDMVENALLVPKPELFAAEQFAPRFAAVVKEPDVGMAYGRLSVARDGFFGQALLTSYRPASPQPKPLPPPDYSGVFGFL